MTYSYDAVTALITNYFRENPDAVYAESGIHNNDFIISLHFGLIVDELGEISSRPLRNSNENIIYIDHKIVRNLNILSEENPYNWLNTLVDETFMVDLRVKEFINSEAFVEMVAKPLASNYHNVMLSRFERRDALAREMTKYEVRTIRDSKRNIVCWIGILYNDELKSIITYGPVTDKAKLDLIWTDIQLLNEDILNYKYLENRYSVVEAGEGLNLSDSEIYELWDQTTKQYIPDNQHYELSVHVSSYGYSFISVHPVDSGSAVYAMDFESKEYHEFVKAYRMIKRNPVNIVLCSYLDESEYRQYLN